MEEKKPARPIHDVHNPYALFVILAIFMSPILSSSLQFICLFEDGALATSQQSPAGHSLQRSKLSSNTSKYFAAPFRLLRTIYIHCRGASSVAIQRNTFQPSSTIFAPSSTCRDERKERQCPSII